MWRQSQTATKISKPALPNMYMMLATYVILNFPGGAFKKCKKNQVTLILITFHVIQYICNLISTDYTIILYIIYYTYIVKILWKYFAFFF